MPAVPESPFPSFKRYVTGHDANGSAILQRDQVIEQLTPIEHFQVRSSVIWRSEGFPYNVSEPFEDPIDTPTTDIAIDGVLLRVADFPPGMAPVMHRTISLCVIDPRTCPKQLLSDYALRDFGIVAEGEIICELDNGIEAVCKKGDIVVQRGTIHAWKNVSDKWARLYFILNRSEPVKVNGKELPHAGYDPKTVTDPPKDQQ